MGSESTSQFHRIIFNSSNGIESINALNEYLSFSEYWQRSEKKNLRNVVDDMNFK